MPLASRSRRNPKKKTVLIFSLSFLGPPFSMCQLVPARMTMESQDGAAAVLREDKATSTDEELLSPPPPHLVVGRDQYFRLWPSGAGGRFLLRQQESLSSNSDVSRPRRPTRGRRQRAPDEGAGGEHQARMKARPLRRQWTTESSDSGYCKRSSRELLRRQDTAEEEEEEEESADSTRRLVRDLQRQSSSSLRLTRQSSSDNQSLFLLRQSTVETYDDDDDDDDVSMTTDFSRPRSCSSGRHPSARDSSPPIAAQTFRHHLPRRRQQLQQQQQHQQQRQLVYGAVVRTPAPLLSATSCSLINLSAVDLEAAQIQRLHRSLRALGPETRRRRSRGPGQEEMPRKVRWSIMATGLILLLMSLILVGATLKMAPLIDDMVRKENEEILRELEEASSGGSSSSSSSSNSGSSSSSSSSSNSSNSLANGTVPAAA